MFLKLNIDVESGSVRVSSINRASLPFYSRMILLSQVSPHGRERWTMHSLQLLASSFLYKEGREVHMALELGV